VSATVILTAGIGRAVRRADALAEDADAEVAVWIAARLDALAVAANLGSWANDARAGIVDAGGFLAVVTVLSSIARQGDAALTSVAGGRLARIGQNARQHAGRVGTAGIAVRANIEVATFPRCRHAHLVLATRNVGAEVGGKAPFDAGAIEAGFVAVAVNALAGITRGDAARHTHAGVAVVDGTGIRLTDTTQADQSNASGVVVAGGGGIRELLAVRVGEADEAGIADEAAVPILATVSAVTEQSAIAERSAIAQVIAAVADVSTVGEFRNELCGHGTMAGPEGQTNAYKHPPLPTRHVDLL
jgi:hypothetical protein